jgi:5'-3' exonuclease
MGIPSYYRKLVRVCPGLVVADAETEAAEVAEVAETKEAGEVDWFFMDFNCLIYHCLRRPGTPAYPEGAEQEAAWVEAFLNIVTDYTVDVIRRVGPRKGAYLAVDGVVPMAKMRQQRMRRFTSAWWASQGKSKDGGAVGRAWDTNAITPGTVFMDRLDAVLRARMTLEGKEGVWRVSGCREAGEGEHKIMAEWRRLAGVGPVGSVAIYGLDADLIVLSLLTRERLGQGAVWLFRESTDKGETQYDLFGRECFEWFSIEVLRAWVVSSVAVPPSLESEWIENYACMMSMLGNDFLPSSLSYKMRDDGHGVLVEQLAGLFVGGVRLVRGVESEVSRDGLTALIRVMAAQEEERVTSMVLKKRRQAAEIPDVSIGEEDWPLAVMEENALLWYGPEGRGRPRLDRNWRDRYLGFFHGFSASSESVDQLCREYLRGVQWVWSYYTGAEVCFEWSYPWSLPPLWVWLAGYLERHELPECGIGLRGCEIEPVEQLAVVLPLASWSLIPPSAVRALPYRAPHLFPSEFRFDSVGKRYFWECECRIPVPSVRMLRAFIF